MRTELNQSKPLDGTRDILPDEMLHRNTMLATMCAIFEKYGYLPIETPTLHSAAVLGDMGQAAYTFKDDKGQDLALPSELTIPFARFVARNYDKLPIPFKRYQIQRVWRAEKTERDNWREFNLCDIDIIGSPTALCGGEIAFITTKIFDALDIRDVTFRVNSKGLLRHILWSNGIKQNDTISEALRVVREFKRNETEMTEQLEKLGLEDAQEVVKRLQPTEDSRETLDGLLRLCDDDIVAKGLEYILDYCEQLGLSKNKLTVDPTLVHEQDYYSNIMLAVSSDDVGLGDLCSGGSYDYIHGGYVVGREFAGVGVAFEFEKIVRMLSRRGMLEINKLSPTQVLVTRTLKDGEKSALREKVAMQIYKSLIEADIPSEIYLQNSDLKEQKKFADKKGIPFVLLAGDNTGEVKLRRLQDGKEKIKTIPKRQIAMYLSNYYDAQ